MYFPNALEIINIRDNRNDRAPPNRHLNPKIKDGDANGENENGSDKKAKEK